jgi:hypothetical protein
MSFVIPGRLEEASPESIAPPERDEGWILRCAIAHHSSLVSLAPRNDNEEVFCALQQ